jgi:hypothetical protein
VSCSSSSSSFSSPTMASKIRDRKFLGHHHGPCLPSCVFVCFAAVWVPWIRSSGHRESRVGSWLCCVLLCFICRCSPC